MYTVDQITQMHAEISSVCQAGCIDCSRLIEIDDKWYANSFCNNLNSNYDTQSFLDHVDQFTGLARIDFCGNNGDPMSHPDIVYICERLNLKKLFCTIATNGAVGSTDKYQRLAELGVEITFGIDGLEDTNHIYRRGVLWNKLMQNVKSFIDSGGSAEWQWLDYPWTRHQIDLARSMSLDLGFKNFFIKSRNNKDLDNHIKNNKHKPTPRDLIKLPTKRREQNYSQQLESTMPKDIDTISCQSANQREIYLQVDGTVWPCCWLPQEQQNNDESKQKFWKGLYENYFNSLHHNTAEEIIKHKFYQDDLKKQNQFEHTENVKFLSCIKYCGRCNAKSK